MKIAMCISGIPGVSVNRTLKNLKRNFPTADVYVGTWRQYEKTFITYPHLTEYPHWLFDEPKAHYHPYLDMPKSIMVSDGMRTASDIYRKKSNWHERTRYQAHQILCHANMVNNLPEKYDIIIRTRFDTFTYAHANFDKYLDDVYQTKVAIGFATLKKDRPTFNIARELDKNDNLEKYLFDSLIMHHGDCIDTKYIFELHNQKKLCPAEFGWYQVLSQPYSDNHRCVSGWANADKHVLDNFLNQQ